MRPHRRKGRRVIGRRGGLKDQQLDAEPCRGLAQCDFVGAVRGRDQRGHAAAVGHGLEQDGQSLGLKLGDQNHDTGDIAARSGVTRGKTKFNRVETERDNRHRACGSAGGGYGRANGDDGVRLGREQFAHQARQGIGLADTDVEDEIAAFDEAKPCQLRQGDLTGKADRVGCVRKMPEAIDPVGRLGARGQRECNCAGQTGHELPSLHFRPRSTNGRVAQGPKGVKGGPIRPAPP